QEIFKAYKIYRMVR
ncbi:hypothetical protein CP061683_1111, partial [Chlamydia psittaci 06-1683]